MKTIYFATGNQHKLAEARQILACPVESLTLEVDEVQTLDPLECAQKKAATAYALAKKPILVEDSSLFIEALAGLPGVFVDYFMKTLDNAGILALLKDQKNRQAVAQTTLCFYDGQEFVLGVGKLPGKISLAEQGENGFGWDPIFMPQGFDKTFAQMDAAEKNKLSMRKLAFEDLKTKLDLS